MDRKNYWKGRPLPFGSQEARLTRADRDEARRRQQRAQNLERIRHIQRIDNEEEIVEVREGRSARLLRWKAERDLKKKVEAKKKLPPFKVGIPHHKFWSPTAGETKPEKKPKDLPLVKKISMVTQRRLAAKVTATGPSGNRDGSQPSTSGVSRQSPHTSSPDEAQENGANRRVSMAPRNYSFKIPTGIPPVPPIGDPIYPDAESAILDFHLNDENKTGLTTVVTRIQNLNFGHDDAEDDDVLDDIVPSSSTSLKIPDGSNSKQTVEAHGPENLEIQEGFERPPVTIPVLMFTVPTPSDETIMSPRTPVDNAVTEGRSRGKRRESRALKPDNIMINVTEPSPPLRRSPRLMAKVKPGDREDNNQIASQQLPNEDPSDSQMPRRSRNRKTSTKL